MKRIKVNLKNRSYEIVIGSNILSDIGKYIKKLNIGTDAYIITNPAVKNRYGRKISDGLKRYGFRAKFKVVPDTEKSKSLNTASSVIRDLTVYSNKKRNFIIAFGGGVIGDLSGFVASVYKRGIPYIQVPTTLLAQVDSSIGGKTALDLNVGKNLIGAFYQPRLVFTDVALLKTLDLRQIRSGLAEVIKYAIIKDLKLFNYLEKNYDNIFGLKKSALEFIVYRCASIKAMIVRKDEREEKGIRTVLNFGHTIGHAIEAAAKFKGYNHGEAVGLGMLVENNISVELKLLEKNAAQKIEALIKSTGLPEKIQKIPIQNIIKAHYLDKKFTGAKNRFVLIRDIGKACVVENIPLKVIRECLKKRICFRDVLRGQARNGTLHLSKQNIKKRKGHRSYR